MLMLEHAFKGRDNLERTISEFGRQNDGEGDSGLQEEHLIKLRQGYGANPAHVLYLHQLIPSYRSFPVSCPTQLGRWALNEWARDDRQVSPFFEFIRHAIAIRGSDAVSRNHALIYPLGGEFFIADMGSTNGTFLNGKAVNSPKRLSPGDVIGISNLELILTPPLLQSRNNRALFVGDPGYNLRGILNDMDQLERQLGKRGFAGNIQRMYKPGKDEVLRALEHASEACSANAHFIFYFSGHGDSNGIIVDNEEISPHEIYSRLSPIMGKRSVILDCCHAGIFNPGAEYFIYHQTQNLIPPDTLVIVASRSDQRAYEQPQPTFGGQILGNLTAAIVQFLIENRQELDLRRIGDYLGEHSRTHYFVKQTPSVDGGSFTIHFAETGYLGKR